MRGDQGRSSTRLFSGRGRLEVRWRLCLDDPDISNCVLAPGPSEVLKSVFICEDSSAWLSNGLKSFSNNLIPKSAGFRVGL
jgi:hypothetical protein